MAFKEKALKRMTEKLNAAGVTWAMGAGWLLCRLGIMDSYHDFDIMVKSSDIEKADKVLTRLGMKSGLEQSDDSFRCSYHFDGADIDMHAGLVLNRGGNAYHVAFDEASVMTSETIMGVQVPMMYPEDMLVYYALEGRDSRAAAIAAWLKEHPPVHTERFEKAVAEPLPEEIRAMLAQF